MFRTYRIGSLFGFPIEVNLTFLILLGVFAIWMGPALGLALVVVAFGSVLLHELGHALVARHLGVPISGIELHFFGGAAKMMRLPKSAGDEVAISAAGPAVSFALGGLGWLLYSVTGIGAFSLLAWINFLLGGFNLIPALPMDGGRIFRALMTKKVSFIRATEISIYIARGFAILLGVYAVATLQLYLVLLAAVLWFMGTAELQMAYQVGNPYSRTQRIVPPDVRFSGLGNLGAPGGQAGPRRGSYVIVRRGGRLRIEYVEE